MPFGEPHRIEEVHLRDPGAGEVLVRVVAAGICHSDVGQADGEWGFPLPAVLGHEGSGDRRADRTRRQRHRAGTARRAQPRARLRRLRPLPRRAPDPVPGLARRDGRGSPDERPSPISGPDGPIATYSLLSCFAHHAVVAAEERDPAARKGCRPTSRRWSGARSSPGSARPSRRSRCLAGSRGAVIGVRRRRRQRRAGSARFGARRRSSPSTRRLTGWSRPRCFGATGGVDVRDEDDVAGLVRSAPREGFDWSIVTVGVPEAMRLGVDLFARAEPPSWSAWRPRTRRCRDRHARARDLREGRSVAPHTAPSRRSCSSRESSSSTWKAGCGSTSSSPPGSRSSRSTRRSSSRGRPEGLRPVLDALGRRRVSRELEPAPR